MPRFVLLLIISLMIISACSQVATPLPQPTATITPSATQTVAVEDITAAATFIRTLPASFTPTFTPSITNTPTVTPTPTATATPTPVSEEELCANFNPRFIAIIGSIALEDQQDFIEVRMPYDNVSIAVKVINLDTGEIIEGDTLTGATTWKFQFTPANFPEIANYEWVLTLQDNERSGMCERRGNFDTRLDELPYVTQTAIAIAESTAEATAESQSGSTLDFTIPDDPESTAEVTQQSLHFPPR